MGQIGMGRIGMDWIGHGLNWPRIELALGGLAWGALALVALPWTIWFRKNVLYGTKCCFWGRLFHLNRFSGTKSRMTPEKPDFVSGNQDSARGDHDPAPGNLDTWTLIYAQNHKSLPKISTFH